MARNAPKPSGRQIVESTSIRGVNRRTVAAIMNAVKAAASGVLTRALIERLRLTRSSFACKNPSGAVVSLDPESGRPCKTH